MNKIEFDNIKKELYTSKKKKPFLVTVPDMNYLTFIGSGHPSDKDFQEACNTLYTLSYIIKFKILRKRNMDYKVNPLEVSWYLTKSDKSIKFNWKAMIMQFDEITNNDFQEAMEIARSLDKKISYDRVKFERIPFGKCVQCFHKGDYNLMNDTMFKMQDFAKSNNYEYDLYTHDIYLNDSRKTKTANLESIMRIGIKKL